MSPESFWGLLLTVVLGILLWTVFRMKWAAFTLWVLLSVAMLVLTPKGFL